MILIKTSGDGVYMFSMIHSEPVTIMFVWHKMGSGDAVKKSKSQQGRYGLSERRLSAYKCVASGDGGFCLFVHQPRTHLDRNSDWTSKNLLHI